MVLQTEKSKKMNKARRPYVEHFASCAKMKGTKAKHFKFIVEQNTYKKYLKISVFAQQVVNCMIQVKKCEMTLMNKTSHYIFENATVFFSVDS